MHIDSLSLLLTAPCYLQNLPHIFFSLSLSSSLSLSLSATSCIHIPKVLSSGATTTMATVVLAVILLAMAGHSSGTWCVCKEGLSEAMLQKTLDYACGAGADCGPIHQGGPCFNPNTVKSHCSYAVNSFFQKKGQSNGTCDFAGTAIVSASDPSYTSCPFPASASGSGTTTPVTTTPSTRIPTTTNTRPYSITPSSTGGGLGIPSGTGGGIAGINPDYSDPSIGFRVQNPRASLLYGFIIVLLPFCL